MYWNTYRVSIKRILAINKFIDFGLLFWITIVRIAIVSVHFIFLLSSQISLV